MPHILFVYKQFPAPHVGHAGGESLFYLMQALHQRGWMLSLVARIRDEELSHLDVVQPLCENILTTPHHRSVKGFRPVAWIRSYLALRRLAKEAMRDLAPDCIHVETTQTALALAGLHLPPSSVRTQDVNWYLAAQQKQRESGLRRTWQAVKLQMLHRIEPPLYDRYDCLLAISKGDRNLLQQALPGREFQLVPLRPLSTQQSSPALDANHVVIFVGAMSRDHNVNAVRWFLDAIWPVIIQEVPDARFYVVGGHPDAEISGRADDQHVFVTGFVDDLNAWYASADVFVAPMLVAGGLLQKMVDAMSLGTPVVCTSACNHGVDAEAGRDLLVADEEEEFSQAVVDILLSPAKGQMLQQNAKHYIEQEYHFDRAIDGWDAVLRQLLDGQH